MSLVCTLLGCSTCVSSASQPYIPNNKSAERVCRHIYPQKPCRKNRQQAQDAYPHTESVLGKWRVGLGNTCMHRNCFWKMDIRHGVHMYARKPGLENGHQAWGTHVCAESILGNGHEAQETPVAMARLPEAKESTSRLWKSAPGQGGMLHMPEIPG